MPGPIRVEWHNRPGWGEYHALRGGKPTHAGFDTYTIPKATIYGTGDNGVVIGKGYVAGGWGHYIDVRYPRSGSRAAYVQRDCHMNEATGLRKGDPVGRGTALGRVGRTGNAKTIYWIRNGVELWHVHSEVYIAVAVIFSKRTNPLPWWGVTTAGGGTPLPLPTENEDDMPTAAELWEFPMVNPHTGKVDTAGNFLRYAVGELIAKKVWEYPMAHPDGGGTDSAGNFVRYNGRVQEMVKALADRPAGVVDVAPIIAAVKEAASSGADLQPILDAIAAVPTAEQNGKAARAAIISD